MNESPSGFAWQGRSLTEGAADSEQMLMRVAM